jgi:pimeloyl-ACP methyl ester carboxylesterase
VKLRLYHHHDGARVAYREAGTGPPLALLHSPGLSHREWEPLVDELSDRFRLVLPDLPLHGDSEDRPIHPYTPEWLADVVAGFCRETCGPRPLVGGHDASAQLLLRAIATGGLRPSRLVLLSSALHRRPVIGRTVRGARVAAGAASVPGLDRLVARAARSAFRPSLAERLTVRPDPAAADLVHHALLGMDGNGNRARAWSRAVRHWPAGDQADLLDAYRMIDAPTLLLWADRDARHPLAIAEEALELIADAQLRCLPGTAFLMAYDDPVGVARELSAFCS